MERALIVQGLQYGDEGKGTIVDYLCRKFQSKLVVRFSGGPQCSHTVVLPDKTTHRFAQFGSGTFAGARTHFGPGMIIDPYSLANEAEVLERWGVANPLSLISIDPDCVITTPWHWYTNRLQELARGENQHGSCGFGIGEVRSDQINEFLSLTVGDVISGFGMRILERIKRWKCAQAQQIVCTSGEMQKYCQKMALEEPTRVADFYRVVLAGILVRPTDRVLRHAPGTVVFEGNQGVLLDEKYGFAPHNTWTDCTFRSAMELIPHNVETTKIGVMRTYMTRHGAGPFVTETKYIKFPDHNGSHRWQGEFRQGDFDAVAARYAIRVSEPDVLAVTHLDCITPDLGICSSYAMDNVTITKIPDGVDSSFLFKVSPNYRQIPHSGVYKLHVDDWFYENKIRTPIAITSSGVTHEQKQWVDNRILVQTV